MVYPFRFYRMVAIGDLYDDQFNFSLGLLPTGVGGLGITPVDTSLLNAVGSAVENWFNDNVASGGMGITAAAHLTSVKLNRIGTDGKYVDDVTQEYVLSPYSGGSDPVYPAAQLAAVVTLGTAAERGRASKGRFYVPPVGYFGALGTDGRLTPTQAFNLATGAKNLIDDINDAIIAVRGPSEPIRVGVASNIGTGTFREVTKVGVGRVPDTMRSRRDSLIEDRVEIAVTPPD